MRASDGTQDIYPFYSNLFELKAILSLAHDAQIIFDHGTIFPPVVGLTNLAWKFQQFFYQVLIQINDMFFCRFRQTQ